MNVLLVSALPILCFCNFLLPAKALQDSRAQHDVPRVWTKLSCRAVKQSQFDSEDKKKTETEASDTMEIVRRRTTLLVTINGQEMKQAMKRDGYATDIYTISSEGKDGLAATHGYTLYPTAHSLVVDSSGSLAIWTESGLTFYSSLPKPMSTTILFACRK